MYIDIPCANTWKRCMPKAEKLNIPTLKPDINTPNTVIVTLLDFSFITLLLFIIVSMWRNSLFNATYLS